MALAYVPPGVTVEEIIQSSVSPVLAANALICLVGVGRGYYTDSTTRNLATDRDAEGSFTLTAPLGTVFAPNGANTFESVKSFTDASAGSIPDDEGGGYKAGTDFTATFTDEATKKE